MSIVPAQSVSGFFGEVVEEAMKTRHVEATDGATQYLVALLADYAHPTSNRASKEALDRPVTLLLDEALHAPDPGDRFERLRVLGDGVLYGCGFFGDHFEARGIDLGYMHGLGTRAYGAASSMLRSPEGPDLFGELARKFATFVEVLAEVADSTIVVGAENPKTLLKVYERWLKTGSDRLAGALTAAGVVPTRRTRGVLQ
jgi:hypothetical protein